MNMILPVTIGGVAAISIVANFLGPPLLAVFSSLPPPPCEGYFPDTQVCLDLGPTRPPFLQRNRANAHCPQWRLNPTWKGRDTFTEKLKEVEAVAKEWESALEEMNQDQIDQCGGQEAVKPPVWIIRQRGLAWSRLQEGVIAGNSEYHHDQAESGYVCWTDALLPLYVEEFGYQPSDEFVAFVSAFDVHSFRSDLKVLQRKSAPE